MTVVVALIRTGSRDPGCANWPSWLTRQQSMLGGGTHCLVTLLLLSACGLALTLVTCNRLDACVSVCCRSFGLLPITLMLEWSGNCSWRCHGHADPSTHLQTRPPHWRSVAINAPPLTYHFGAAVAWGCPCSLVMIQCCLGTGQLHQLVCYRPRLDG